MIPIGKPIVELKRKSKTFWSILGEHHVGSTILRVPITFPPEKFEGKLLSAMCTPDLLGTQGQLSRVHDEDGRGGLRGPATAIRSRRTGRATKARSPGLITRCRLMGGALKIPFTLSPNGKPGHAVLELQGEKIDLEPGKNTELGPADVQGGSGRERPGHRAVPHCRDRAGGVALHDADLDRPGGAGAARLASELLRDLSGEAAGRLLDARARGRHLGPERGAVIDEDAFLEQAYTICDEREKMFFNTLDKTKRGVVTCVFDTSDRVQHMFFRYLEENHPAHKANGNGIAKYANSIEDLYKRMDSIVGKTMKYVDDDTVLFVLSDHGFKSFQRGINLNTWLERNGYLKAKDEPNAKQASYLRGIDWSKTRAYSFGLAGIYLNVKGREAEGRRRPQGRAGADAGDRGQAERAARRGARRRGRGDHGLSKSACYSGPVHARRARRGGGLQRGLSLGLGRGDRQRPAVRCSRTI